MQVKCFVALYFVQAKQVTYSQTKGLCICCAPLTVINYVDHGQRGKQQSTGGCNGESCEIKDFVKRREATHAFSVAVLHL